MIIGVYKNTYQKEQLEPFCDDFMRMDDVKTIKEQIKPEIVYMFVDIYSLKLSIAGLADFFNYVEKQGATLEFVDDEDIKDVDIKELLNMAAIIQSKIASYKSIDSLARAKAKGIVGGRPSISQEKAIKIQKLYAEKFPMRWIAQQCGVSVGTVYKYCNLEEKEN